MTAATSRPMRNPARMLGLSLIELMISLTLGLLILLGLSWVYLGSSQTYRAQDQVARMQEGARYAFEFIGKDLRMTGATGCYYTTRWNALNNSSTTWYANLRQPVDGLEQDGTANAVTEFSDAIRLLRADISNEYIVQSHDAAGAQFTLTATPDPAISAGELLVATDCTHVAVLQATAVAGATLNHAASGTPGNATINLGTDGGGNHDGDSDDDSDGDGDDDADGNNPYSYAAGSRLYRLNAVTYYIDTNPAGEPALYRLMRTTSGGSAATEAQELVEGVQDLQITYGVDTSTGDDGEDPDRPDPDLKVNQYLTADEIDDNTTWASEPSIDTSEERWRRVVSVKISLLMRTVEDAIAPAAQTYLWDTDSDGSVDDSVTAGDRRLRKVFTHVIKVRNR